MKRKLSERLEYALEWRRILESGRITRSLMSGGCAFCSSFSPWLSGCMQVFAGK